MPKSNLPKMSLLTTDIPITDYSSKELIDMEGSAFFDIASKLTSKEFICIMKIISDEAKDNNSKVTGITMESLHNLELTNPRIDDLVVTHSLLERKDEFMKRSDAFLVLPGGVGSLDELAEILASNQLGIINKPVGLLNTDGYYDHLIAWFEKAVNEGFITQENLDELIITDNCEEMVERILEEKSESSKDWKGRLGL